MPFDPAKLQNLSIFEPPPSLAESSSERTLPMRGWATPLRRPRRVWKKLRDRGFAAHHGGPVRPQVQRRERIESAPALAAELNLGHTALFKPSPLLARYKAIRWDGDKATPAPALPYDQMDYREVRYPERPLVASFEPLDPIPQPAPMAVHRTFIGRDYFYDRQVGLREIDFVIRIFCPEGIDPTGGEAARLFERAASNLAARMNIVARGDRTSKVIARQTSYRPVR